MKVELVTEARLYFNAEKKRMMAEITRSLYDVNGSDVRWLGSSTVTVPLDSPDLIDFKVFAAVG